MRKSFIIHIDSLSVLDDLTDEQCGELFRAIKSYQCDQQISLSPIAKIAFSPFKNQFERDAIKYENLCEKNRLIAVNRHKTNSTKSTTGNESQPTVTKSTDNKSDSDSDSDSKSKSKSDNTKRLDQSAIDYDALFDKFWQSGIRKVNKKKAQPIFNKLLKKPDGNAGLFTQLICEDIQTRLRSNQLGFSEMHPTTYLNGERWNDEKVIHNENPQRSTTKPSLIDRVKANTAQRRKSREAEYGEPARHPVGENDSDVRPQVCQPVRGSSRFDVGDVSDGDFRETDG